MTSNLLNIPDEVLKASKTIKPHLSFIKATLSEQVTMETRIRSVTPVESNESNLSIVFLHGASFSSKNWDEDLNTLSIFGALGYPTFALDLPGFGETKYSEANFKDVDYFSATIDMITTNKIILIAPSMSGTFAIPFLVSKSEKVAGFVGVSPVTPGDISESSLRACLVPTLLMYGSRDSGWGLRCQEYFKPMPNFESVIIEDAGHAAYMNNPDKFHQLLYNFVKPIEAKQD